MISSLRKFIFSCALGLPLALAATSFVSSNDITPSSSVQPTRTTSLPSTITSGPSTLDDSYAGRCWSSWNNYRSAEEAADDIDHPYFGSSTWIENFVTTLINATVWEDIEKIPLTTLCDGVPRAIHSRNSTSFATYVSTFGYDSPIPVASTAIRTAIKPHCSVDDDASDCTRLWSTWNYVSSTYLHSEDYDNSRMYERRRPPCAEPMRVCPHNSKTGCRVNPGDRQTLFYWPVTTVSGDFCQQNGSTLTPVPTDDDGAPNTVEFGDLTFTSPSVYVVIDTATAEWQEQGRRPPHQKPPTYVHYCGPTATAVTLTLDPTDLSTIQADNFRYNGDIHPVNWTDFNHLEVPLSAYNFQCSQRTVAKYWSHCPKSTMIYDDYSPYFQVPQELVSEMPEWKQWGCSDRWGMHPKMVRIEPEMTTSLAGLRRHKGVMTARPIGSPIVGLPSVTETAIAGESGPANTED